LQGKSTVAPDVPFRFRRSSDDLFIITPFVAVVKHF